MAKVLIVGGGISGLSCAHTLQKLGLQVCLAESSSRLGGWIHTQRKPVLFEAGPRSLLPRKGEHTLRLLAELGLDQHMLPAHRDSAKRFVLHQAKPCQLPTNLVEFFRSPLLGPAELVSALYHDLRPSSAQTSDETIREFALRKLGRGLADKLLDPLVAGVYAGNTRDLSLKNCFPDLHLAEQRTRSGSLFLGMYLLGRDRTPSSKGPAIPMYSFQRGVGELVDRLGQRFMDLGGQVRLSSPVSLLSFAETRVDVTFDSSSPEVYDHVVVATNSLQASKLLPRGSYSEQLSSIRHASLWVVQVAYERDVLSHCRGFGLLVPSGEDSKILGITFDSHTFPSQSTETRLTVMLGGDRRPELCKLDQESVQSLALYEINRLLGVEDTPVYLDAKLQRDCIAQYTPGHAERVVGMRRAVAESSFGRVSLIGASYQGVSVNDCIRTSQEHAHELVELLGVHN